MVPKGLTIIERYDRDNCTTSIRNMFQDKPWETVTLNALFLDNPFDLSMNR